MSMLAAPPISPFKGLAAFDDSELDALFFFGREREREIVVANMLASRLTILYGESGVGKSSLLGAAVVRDLREEAPDATVALHDTWSGSLEGLAADVADAAEGYLILDQFEEYFLYHGDDAGPGTLLHDLPELLHESRVNVLLSLREDALARLDAFKARIPHVFANQVRLEHLDRDAARAAVLGPIGRWNELTGDEVEIEPALVDAVLDEVAVEGRSQDLDRIEAPYLQLVLERLWETERAAGVELLRLETLRRLGGARTIVRDHLLRALARLPAEQQDVAASMFEHLVTPSGTKIAHRAPDLAQYADVPESALQGVLATLTTDRIVHSVEGSDRYEIFHDVLAEPISSWRLQRRLDLERVAARRRQRRLGAVAVAALVALGIVGALAVWAFSERGHARKQAVHARARALEARSLEQLAIDPRRSVKLALAAAGLEPSSGTAETVLRQALIQDRLRVTVHVGGKVGAVAVSPNGRLLAAAREGGRIEVADARTGHVLRRLRAGGAVTALGFAGGGRTLVAGSVLHASSWDVGSWTSSPAAEALAAAMGPHGVATFQLRGDFARAAPHVQRLTVTPTIAAAVVQEPDGPVRAEVFDRSGRLRRVLPGLGVTAVAFSPDGRMLATGNVDGLTTLWDPLTGKRLRVLRDPGDGGPGKRIESAVFSPDGKLLGTAGDDGVVRVWDVADGTRIYPLFAHTNPVSALAWSPDGRVLASGSADRTVRVWRAHGIIGAGSLAATLAGNGDAVTSLAYSADSRRLVTGSADGTARVWDVRPDQELQLLSRAAAPAVTAAWSGRAVVAAWANGIVRVLDPRTRRVVHELHRAGPLTAFAVAAGGGVAAAGGADGTTVAWSLDTGDQLATVGGAAPVGAVALSPDGAVAASGDAQGRMRVWNTRSGRVRWSSRQEGEVVDVAFAPDGKSFATASRTGTILWSTTDDRPLRRLAVRGGVVRVAFSPDGRYVAAGAADGRVFLWFAGSGRLDHVYRGHKAAITDVVFSSDGVFLATSSHDADGRVWNVATGRSVHVLRGQFASIAAIAFSKDRRWVATAGPIAAVLWPVSTGQLLFYLRGHGPLLTSVAFSPQGYTILSSSEDGTVRTYTCDVCGDLGALAALAEQRLARTR